MKFLIVLSALVALVVSQETYTSEHDAIPIDEVLKQPGVLKAWYSCFVDLGPCEEKAQQTFKASLAEAIQQACAKCTPQQKYIMKRFLEALKRDAPADYEIYRNKYDPENKYLEQLEKAIA